MLDQHDVIKKCQPQSGLVRAHHKNPRPKAWGFFGGSAWALSNECLPQSGLVRAHHRNP